MSRIAFQKTPKGNQTAGEEIARNAETEAQAETGSVPASSEP